MNHLFSFEMILLWIENSEKIGERWGLENQERILLYTDFMDLEGAGTLCYWKILFYWNFIKNHFKQKSHLKQEIIILKDHAGSYRRRRV